MLEGKLEPVVVGIVMPAGMEQFSSGRSLSRLSSIPMMKPAQRAVREQMINHDPVERRDLIVSAP